MDTADDASGTDIPTEGCVDVDYLPTLDLPIDTYGAAAAMVEWAQENLSGHWGHPDTGSPMTYLGNTDQRDVNREIVCDSSFTNLGTAIGGDDGSSDSCDEFPFAASYQSAPLGGLTSGADCAQVQATEISNPTGNLAADWSGVEPIGSFTGSEPCVRGHIPLLLNTNVGTAYWKFISANRIIDGDQYWIDAY